MDHGVDIASVLHERLRRIAKRPVPTDSFGQAIAAAIAPDMRSRGWKLVALAASLRRTGDHDLALALLDAVVGLGSPEDVSHAAYTTAIAIHTDRADYNTARKLGAQQLAEHVDEYLLSALARTYAELFRSTEDDAFKREWLRISDALRSFERAE